MVDRGDIISPPPVQPPSNQPESKAPEAPHHSASKLYRKNIDTSPGQKKKHVQPDGIDPPARHADGLPFELKSLVPDVGPGELKPNPHRCVKLMQLPGLEPLTLTAKI